MTTMRIRDDSATQLLVVGAGPVGLLAALNARRRGLSVELLDQTSRGFGQGRAALLHASTLGLLSELGVEDSFRAAGRAITEIGLHVDGFPREALKLASPALAIAQTKLEEALLQALIAAGGKLREPFQLTTLHQDARQARARVVRRELVTLGSPAHYSEWEPVEAGQISADFVLGADGYDSRVRTALGIELTDVGSTESFAMFEATLAHDLGTSVEIGFSEGLVCAVTPLPDAKARFAFQLDRGLDAEPDSARLQALLRERAPFERSVIENVHWGSVIHFERRLVRRFGAGRTWLAGDAAHVTSPIGAQSINLGFAEAAGFVDRMTACAAGKAPIEALEQYARGREREWHKLLGFHVQLEVAPHAPSWLRPLARKIAPVLPASGEDMKDLLRQLGLTIA